MVTRISNSPDETLAIGAELAARAQPGLIIGLVGDLGAGKTQLVKGFARALGVTDRIHSPTFTLVNVYRTGALPFYHLDLYRLETPETVFGAGLEEYLPPKDGVAVVEWFDRLGNTMQFPNIMRVNLQTLGEFQREISYDNSRS